MKITKLSMITSAVIAATLSASAVAGHHEEKISMGFNAMDKDGNGYIVGSESSGVIDSKLLAKMDTDGDSMISRVEFNKFVDEKPSMFSDDIITQVRSEEHTSNSSHITISYAVFCLKKKKNISQKKKKNNKKTKNILFNT